MSNTKPREILHESKSWVLKSEYSKLKKEVDQLSEYCGEVRYWQNRAEDLSESLKFAAEALEFECGNRCAIGINPCNAREELDQIYAKHPELKCQK